MIKLTIGICTGGTMRSETVTSLIGAMDVLKHNGIPVMLSIQIGGYVAHNRNRLVETAKKNDSTHLMFIDNDMTFLPSAIQRLVDHDKEIVGANYNTRGNMNDQGGVISTLKLADEKGNLINADSIPSQLFECFAVATGFMLINMKVFDKLKKPYFIAWEDEQGEHHTEDVEFCKTAHEKGIKVWCNPTIKVGHIGNYTY